MCNMFQMKNLFLSLALLTIVGLIGFVPDSSGQGSPAKGKTPAHEFQTIQLH